MFRKCCSCLFPNTRWRKLSKPLLREPRCPEIELREAKEFEPVCIDRIEEDKKITFYFESAIARDIAEKFFLTLIEEQKNQFKILPKQEVYFLGFHELKQKTRIRSLQPYEQFGLIFLSSHDGWKARGVDSKKTFALHIASMANNNESLSVLIRKFKTDLLTKSARSRHSAA